MLEFVQEIDLQLTQLGAAIEAINHEFDALDQERALKSTYAWMLWQICIQISVMCIQTFGRSVDHLDGYLTSFDAVSIEAVYRKEVEIKGRDIARSTSLSVPRSYVYVTKWSSPPLLTLTGIKLLR